ncbi:solute carrier organic anion transporter family member 5A1 [Aricia agestis]|uniref:solute carrier organic anion transporter family member 5A1 n=1 Tax=Aricia agestis TaxID=91739 RepID=UPI001C207E43|nr:solute carrier organic anion transporter family member 5A1 [Aricia agestis]XP_041974936.1 solute carrier organic anion transporter family member 5A1 [Aricia agestis]
MTEGEKQQNAGGANAAPQHRKGHRRQESMYAMTGLYAESGCADVSGKDAAGPSAPPSHPALPPRDAVKCHSRNPSAGIYEREREREKEKEKPHQLYPEILDIPHDARDCGILTWRPLFIQRFSSIKVFVFFLSILVTLQQALSSGYINSVITTIEKRFEIPSSLSGLIASSYEIGNVITVIFVSYLGSRRHIPVWIAVGAVIMGIGSLVFVVPHFIAEANSEMLANNKSDDNICRLPGIENDMGGLGRLSQGLPPSNLRPDNCIKSSPSTFMPVMIFVVAQLLLGCGGSPLLTLGTTYVDDHVRPESSSMYIGCMYSMGAFGPVLGFLLGAYLLSFHMDSFSGTVMNPGDHRWIGMWWGGFLLCGLLLILVAIPFFSFPKVLVREKEKIRLVEKAAAASGSGTKPPPKQKDIKDTGYGKDIKDIPVSMWRLLKNPVYVVTCLGACMELMIVSGFVVFLPKYLETQFSLGKSQASVFTGSIAIPGACIGIFMGGCLLKRLELRPRGAVQFVLISNTVCLSCYALLFFLGCDNIKMAGTTIPYTNNSNVEPFKVNLTAACNFNCLCADTDMEPVCGNNGLTYFSPCHAGCAAFSSRSNFTNCACVHEHVREEAGSMGVVGAAASALTAAGARDYGEVTVVPVATAGACNPPCTTIFPFLVLLFFMTFVVAVTQMPLLMIVLRSVSEEERSFALGMQFVIFRLFGYIPAPILFGNLIDSTCILWKQSCSGEKGGRCLLYDIEQFRYRYVGLCGGIKIVALGIFIADWWLVRRQRHLDTAAPLDPHRDIAGSIISLDKLFEEPPSAENTSGVRSVSAGTPQEAGAGAAGGVCRADSARSHAERHDRVLVASRHHRNDSKTIQLEPRARPPARRHSRQHSLDDARPPLPRSASHSRDFKSHSRSNSRDFKSHSRSNSRDFKTHSRSNSRDLGLEQLRQLAIKSMDSLDLTVLPLTRCADGESERLIEGGVLRHRRTNSKDLRPETKHKRTSSHHITMEPGDLTLQIQKGRSADQLAPPDDPHA